MIIHKTLSKLHDLYHHHHRALSIHPLALENTTINGSNTSNCLPSFLFSFFHSISLSLSLSLNFIYHSLIGRFWEKWKSALIWCMSTRFGPIPTERLQPNFNFQLSSITRSSLFRTVAFKRLQVCNLRTSWTWSSNILPMLRMEKVKFACSMSQTLDTAVATLYARFQISI